MSKPQYKVKCPTCKRKVKGPMIFRPFCSNKCYEERENAQAKRN